MYVEDLLALNFMMNTSLLYLTARLSGRQPPYRRLVAGGLFAALYSLTVFWPQAWLLYSWFGKLIMSLVIVGITFKPRKLLGYVKICSTFFLVTFLLAGTIFAMQFFGSIPASVQGGVYYIRVPRPGMLFLGALIGFILLTIVWHFNTKQSKHKELNYRFIIEHAGELVEAQAFVDTGNQLKDPLSGRALCVVSYNLIKPLLPEVLRGAYSSGGSPLDALTKLPDLQAGRFGVAPFRSLENSGMLITFRPDSVKIFGNNLCLTRTDLIFAISTKSLDGDFEILVNPDILDQNGGVDC